MFRHERPQKGRYRQFHQIGVEVFGIATPDLDAELILMSARLWQAFGLRGLELQVNSLGTPAARARYRETLVGYLRRHIDVLDEDSRRRLDTNPLRVLDSKHPAMQPVIAAAPSLLDQLDDASRLHFDTLCRLLDGAGVAYRVNPRLVRGLDYYTRTVFEWVTSELGAQGTVCAGGRYDGLVEQLGGQATAAAGFALGLERLTELAAQQQVAGVNVLPQIYVAALGDDAVVQQALLLAEKLRDAGMRVELNAGGGSLKSQLKRADKSGARFAAILGENELAKGGVSVKNLRAEEPQQTVAFDGLPVFLLGRLGSNG
jgi:histidyl-tRNA synthetase